MSYREKLKDPRWQKKRLRIFERDNWCCTECGDGSTELHAHHDAYEGNPWEVSDDKIKTLCKPCHERTHGIAPSNELILLARLIQYPDIARGATPAIEDATIAMIYQRMTDFILNTNNCTTALIIERTEHLSDRKMLAELAIIST